MNILIVDDIHEILLQKLDKAGISYSYQPDFTREQAEEQIPNFDGLIIRSKFQVDKEFIDINPNLKMIGRAGAGMDNIDEAYAASKGIFLIPANEGNRDAVGEHMIGMLLSLMNNLNRGNREIREGQWNREENRGYELKGRTVALIGYGHNGQAMAKKLSGFDVNVIAYDKYKTGFSDQYATEVSMEEVVRRADVLSFHIPLTRETKGMVDDEYLFHFRKPIFFLMGARGGIVNVPAVIKKLDEGKIIAAAFDVLPVEKFPALGEQSWYQNLIERDNVLLSPHVAGWTFESYFKLSDVLADKIIAFLNQ
ncbi:MULTISPECIES: NAD(P)-dependent oxidoreductase [Sphingobacterium]|uniref:2-hydroxyacid dehydrogenase n=1 Tax=Sphingobacterium cellulitidis TaxID=1768011 RepID=A0A8H9KS83_9SPHI|nr:MULTISPECIES: NAD(P)-dependent oxidoreductase [Sphingobacterium]MBA8985603.1 D-3-phosphoglycerate dehydrogenase [Sphingobacterium soli]WFB64021.1 NAD(P)-dependent oxidoreductase [Sphingobacterium sp. WM]GGE08257.1 2-hydroxyacid dehydrogenase [Sphingobacterium soli]